MSAHINYKAEVAAYRTLALLAPRMAGEELSMLLYMTQCHGAGLAVRAPVVRSTLRERST